MSSSDASLHGAETFKRESVERKMPVQRLNTLILFSKMFSSPARIGFNALQLRAALPFPMCIKL